jgi:hypothetical protein
MNSRFIRRLALACAAVSGLCGPSRAEAPANVGPAALSIYEGVMIIRVVVDNKSGVLANANLICGASLASNGRSAVAKYSAPARVTASTVTCTFRLPYRVETSDPATTYLYGGVRITSEAATSASPPPQGVGFVHLGGFTVYLPANGAITSRTLSGVI